MLVRVVNLDRTPERLASFRADNPDFTFIERMSAVDGSTVNRSELVRANILSSDLVYSDGAIGCALSHLAIWNAAIDANQPITVLEDDAILNSNFRAEYERLLPTLPPDWEMVMWGFNTDTYVTFNLMDGVTPAILLMDHGELCKNMARFRDEPRQTTLFPLSRAHGTVCYTISPLGAQRFLSHAIPLRPMDVAYPGLNRTLPNTGIDNMMGSIYHSMRAYVSIPPMVITKNDHSISTVQTHLHQKAPVKPFTTRAPDADQPVVDYGNPLELTRLGMAPNRPLPVGDNATLPRLIHFVFGLDENEGGKPFSFIHYMAIKSARETHPDHRILFWHAHEPNGPYWDAARSMVEPARIDAPTAIHGNSLPDYLHKADITRLAVLQRFGGIYFDMDTICVRPLRSLFQGQPVVGEMRAANGSPGICPAIMLSPPGTLFLAGWWESLKNYNATDRAMQMIRMPYEIASAMPDQVKVLPPSVFFEAGDNEEGVNLLFRLDRNVASAYAHHLWEGRAWSEIATLNEDNIFTRDTTYNRLARRFIDSDEHARINRIKTLYTASGKRA